MVNILKKHLFAIVITVFMLPSGLVSLQAEEAHKSVKDMHDMYINKQTPESMHRDEDKKSSKNKSKKKEDKWYKITPLSVGLWGAYNMPGRSFDVIGGRISIYYDVEHLYGLDFGLIPKVTHSMYGVQMGFIGNQIDHVGGGVQFGLICNQVGRDVPGREELFRGARLGLINLCFGNVRGVDMGAFNYVKKQIKGIQFGIFNIADDVRGVQFGIANVAQRLVGVQIGVFNADNYGSWLPLLNFGW